MSVFLDRDERFLGLDDAWADPERARCVVLPVPYERTSSFGEGSAAGPEAILQASHQVEFFDTEADFTPHKLCDGIITTAPLAVDGLNGAALCERLRAATREHLDAGRFVVTLGGEHSSIVGAVAAHADRHDDLAVLQLDAHSDLRAEYEGDRWSHACAMARVLDFHDRLVQVGVRSEAAEERATRDRLAIPFFGAEAIHAAESDGRDWIDQVVTDLPTKVYVTLDCDVLDPSLFPSTGTPEPNGLSWRQIDQLLGEIARRRTIVGLDLTELLPIPGFRHPEFLAAKLVSRTIGRVFLAAERD